MIVLSDLDHTLSDAYWRDTLIGTVTWDAYHELSIEDKPIQAMVEMIRCLHKSGWTIIGLTGRPERWRQLTMRWLMLHEIPIETLIMRANDDYRPNAITKLQAVQTNFKTLSQIAFVLEDNESAVSALKGLGLTVLQVHVGGKNETTRAASSAGRPVREAQ